MSDIINIYMPSEIRIKIAENAKKLRLQKSLKRTTLAVKSGVTVSSIKRFETTGNISLSSLLKLANALDCLNDFLKLFSSIEPTTIEELEKMENTIKRKRGRI